MKTKYPVKLTPTQRTQLKKRLRGGAGSVLELCRLRILLMADENGPAYTDKKIAEALECSENTVGNVRRYFCERGLEGSICRKKQDKPSRKPVLNGSDEAHVIALACSEAPDGRARWTLRLLAKRVVELEIAEHICPETIRKVLKKHS